MPRTGRLYPVVFLIFLLVLFYRDPSRGSSATSSAQFINTSIKREVRLCMKCSYSISIHFVVTNKTGESDNTAVNKKLGDLRLYGEYSQ